jgi:DNA (cytosine-5)-methyltransferase 1
MRTIVAGGLGYHHKYIRRFNKYEICLAGSFPLDYDFIDNKPEYLIGMSVPPLMVYRLSKEIEKQRLSNIDK